MELFYVSFAKSTTKEAKSKKELFVSLTTLPDLALSNEATFIRHRSVSDFFSLFKDDPTLREYFPSSFAITHAINQNKSYHEN
ncbi:MAG: hypothetical protein RBR59_07670 [Sulfurimonadaceae bacterium]|nr:hypothetical protein [Sulfurimonadaceae bacterium]